MGLVEVPVRQLHQGVSRQPDHVRLVGQLQDAENLLFRVEEAGFTKRFGTLHIGIVEPAPAPGVELPFHVIDLGATEKYGMTMHGGNVHIVNLLSGVGGTITIAGSSGSYISSTNPQDFAFSTILDETFVVCRDKTVAMKADLTTAGFNAVVFQVFGGRAGVYSITVDGHTGTTTTSATVATDWDTSHIAQALVTSLGAIGGYNILRLYGSYIIIYRDDNAVITSSASDAAGGRDIVMTNTGTPITSTDKLPAYAIDGMIVTIGADTNSGAPHFYMKFVAAPMGGSAGYWTETVAPGIQYKLDETTMPHVLVRTSLDHFTLQAATWDNRNVGDTTTVPNPDFVGKTITDVTLFRDRLDLISGEHHWFSATGEYFRFWPKFSTQSLDNDPFGIRGSAGRVAIQRFCLPYRKTLWSTSDNEQFEVSAAAVLTPKTGVMDLTTRYLANQACRPVVMGPMLYFTSFNNNNAIVLEYTFDELSLTSVATEITKHVRGYMPITTIDVTADPPTGNLFFLSDQDTSSLYVWTVFWNGQQRDQSCWSKWTFPGATVMGCRVVAGALFLLMRRADNVTIERINLADGTTNFPLYSPRLDRSVYNALPTYDAGTDTTTFTQPYPTAGISGVMPSGRAVTVVSTSVNNVTVQGNVASAIFGFTYPSRAVLSKQYHRDQQGVAILNGKLRLKQITVSHKSAGYYEVRVDAPGRSQDVFKFTGRNIGVADDLVGVQPIDTGLFMKGGLEADGVDATFAIHNDTHLPHTINEIVFRGEFTEIVRQG
jgi:hypothetical protein